MVQRERMVAPGAPLWVAVSGGMDSMVLWHVLRALGHPCHVAHVDHGLRGAESDGDRLFVEEQARRSGCVFRSIRVDPRRIAEEEGLSIQMAARRLRYHWFGTLLREGPPTMALGHHRDDAVETLMIDLLRGTGTRGWSAIPAVSSDDALPECTYVRPLLGIAKVDLAAYGQEHGIPFREDASNADPKYLRNRVRHELLPYLEQLRPGAGRTMGRSVAMLRELGTAARSQVQQELAGVVRDGAGAVRVPLPLVEGSRTPLLLLSELLHGKGFHPDMLERLLEAVLERSSGAVFTADDITVEVQREELVIRPRTGGFPSFELEENDIPGRAGTFAFSWGPASAIDLSEGLRTVWLDVDALTFPLVLRPWKAGDRMRPIGLNGSRTVSDILIDAKVAMTEKAGTYVLVSGDAIVWLAGHRVAAGFAADATSRRVLRITRTT